MPHNPISVLMKVYALQLKQKSTAAGCNGILRNFRTATSWKENRRGEVRTVTLVVPRFHYFQGSYVLYHEKIFILHKFLHRVALDYVIRFY